MINYYRTGRDNLANYEFRQYDNIANEAIWSAYNPKIGSYPLPESFSSANGWAMVTFVSNSTPVSSTYPFSINDGSSSNALNFRINNTASGNLPQMELNLRVGGVIKSAADAYLGLRENVVHTMAVSWRDDGYQYLLCDDDFDEETVTDARSWSATTINVGGRNGGADALDGYVTYAEIGNEYLTPAKLAARVASKRNALIIATAGQSNIQNWADGEETTAPFGRNAFVDGLFDTTATYSIPQGVLVNAAEGGSAIFKSVNPDEYWIEDDLVTAGGELIQFFAKVDYQGQPANLILWSEGESESHQINNVSYPDITSETYKARNLAVFTAMRKKYPNARILVMPLGIRDTFTNTGGIQAIVDVQNELMAEYDWIDFLAERYDLPLYTDGVHQTDASYAASGARAANAVLAVSGYPVPYKGPEMVSATRSGVTVTLTIKHNGGTDFTPTTGIEGGSFVKNSDGTVINAVGVRTNATTVTYTLDSDPGESGRFYQCYDNYSFTSLSNILVDDTTLNLPIRRGYVVVS